jgi:hypothetical protein
MKKFILRRKMIYTERAEVEAESFDAAKEILEGDDVDFEVQNDDMLHDSSYEYIGDT